VTNQIEAHEHLVFSIKHTALDFWRRVKVNPCLGKGNHPYVVEVQCQREYEGKGAHPNYVMKGVIDYFEENEIKRGLRDLVLDDKFKGIYTWSRGGGWFGPYPKNEFWCDINASVLARWAACDGKKSEEEIFNEYARDVLKLDEEHTQCLRRIALKSAEAILRARYCEAFDRQYAEGRYPVLNWMRDDRIGGPDHLEPMIEYLIEHNMLTEALEEKRLSRVLWNDIVRESDALVMSDVKLLEFIRVSARYGETLFRIAALAWEISALGALREHGSVIDNAALSAHIAEYDAAWSEFELLCKEEQSSTVYKNYYIGWSGDWKAPGLEATIAKYR
jgi:hypothetical protein